MTGTRAVVRQTLSIPVIGVGVWAELRSWLAARAVDGVEMLDDDSYRRTARIDGQPAVVRMMFGPDMVRATVTSASGVDVGDVDARVRRVLDLERDPSSMKTRLGHDPWLASLCDKHDALRVPGGWDPFELAVRAVLGQQVTIGAARRLACDLVAVCGTPLPTDLCEPGLSHTFPDARAMASTDLGGLRMPGARRATLTALAAAAAADPDLLRPDPSLDVVIARLRAVKGIGEWTAHYIALRALRHPDAFPASDIGLLRGAATAMGGRPTPAALQRRAERWRPWRAYAAQLLWAEDGDV